MRKEAFREACKRELFAKKRQILESKVVEYLLLSIIKKNNFKNILLYNAMGHELALARLIHKIRQDKRRVYTPFMEGKSFKVVQFRLPLRKKRFGIYESDNSFFKHRTIDLAIVPILGVDSDFRRVGFGKGMYDRFFSTLKKQPRIIFIQPTLCFSRAPLTKMHDIQADCTITPKITMKRGLVYANRTSNRRLCYRSQWNSRVHLSKKIRTR